jgi:tetratricopeptide (TPR) repeat protein
MVFLAALAAGCGPKAWNQQREESIKRWASARAEMTVRLADACFARGEYGRAQENINELVRTGVPYAPLFTLAARLAAERGELDNARTYAESAKAIDPTSAEARYVLGTVRQTLGQAEEALAEYSEAARLDPSQSHYVLAEAELLVAQGRAEQAATSLGDAAGRLPGRAELHGALADVLCVLGRYSQAVGSYRIALRIETQRNDLKERLATALYNCGSYSEAAPLLAELAESEPEFAAGWAIRMRAECFLAMGRTAEARALYQAESQGRRDPVGPLVGLAQCDILENRLPSARTNLERALARDPQHVEANALMGYVLVATGCPDQAVPYLTLALRDPRCSGRATVERLLAVAKGKPLSVSPAALSPGARAPAAPAAEQEGGIPLPSVRSKPVEQGNHPMGPLARPVKSS